MKRIRKFLVYVWALMAVPILLATFIGNNVWARKLVNFTGLKVSPLYTGMRVCHFAPAMSQIGERVYGHNYSAAIS